jgi:DNA-binding beta-propeller fold protein YncE
MRRVIIATALAAVTVLAGSGAAVPVAGGTEGGGLAHDAAAGGSAAAPQARSYTFYVAAESDDIVEKVELANGSLRLVRSIEVGNWPNEIEGPHGLAVSPGGEYWYLSLAHGQPGPNGSVVKYATGDDAWLAEVEVGMFPATMALSPSIGLLYVVNFNLHGLPEPSSISVIDPESMSEVGRVGVGVMPHGARMNRRGSRLYSVNMMDDVLVEVDTYRMEVTRRLGLTMHAQHMLDGTHERHMAERAAQGGQSGGAGEMGGMGGGMDMGGMMQPVKPTWATPPTADGKVYVAGNGAAKILEIDVDTWAITREFTTPAGPYNLDVSPDGKLLAATYKSSKSVGFWNLESGEEVARVETLRPIPHGIIISPDGRYAFATIEGIGGEPGSVEAYDLTTFGRVASLDIAKQAGGIAFWRMQ